ncbi:MAG: AAA family ATPase, partial [Micromonosporaceae bacterium]|nr:AAA family ATPase [Micromonosporaceae bacterium]
MEIADVWSLVARDAELRAIQAALEAGRTGVVLVGEHGVGKTRLAREALANWSATGGDIEWVVATRAAASIPFGAVSGLLPEEPLAGGNLTALLGQVAAQLTDRVGRRHGQPGSAPREGTPEPADAGPHPTPTVVGVDDAHLLDEASAGLLHQLAVRGVLVPLLTVRSGEPAPDAVTALWKDVGTRLAVPPLPPAAIDQILDEALDGRIEAVSRSRLRRLADGNPLLLRELLADGLETGALVRTEGIWRWDGTVPPGARVAELVAARLQTVCPATRRALELIACGEPLALSLVERLVETEAVEAAERAGMVVAEPTGVRPALRLIHPLYGEVLRASLPVSRARTIWGQLAGALADDLATRPPACADHSIQGRAIEGRAIEGRAIEGRAAAGRDPADRRGDTLLAGVWQLQAGVTDRPEVLLAAAEQALSRFDLELAERLLRAARAAAPSAAADVLLARALQFRGRGQEAAEVLSGAVPAGGRWREMSAVTQAVVLYWGLGQATEAEHALGEATGTDPGEGLAEATRSWLLLFDGRCQLAFEVSDAALNQSGLSDEATIWATMSGVAAAGLAGRPVLAGTIAKRGQTVVEEHADRYPWGLAQLDYARCLAAYATGDLVGAARIAEAGHQAAVARDAAPVAGLWSAFRGIVAKAQGHLSDARAWLREAVAVLADNDTYRVVRVCLAELAGAAAMAGDAAAARDWLARADARRDGSNRLFDAWVERNRAWVEAASGTVSTAVEVALAAAERARETEQPAIEALCRYDAARLSAAPQVYRQLRELAEQMEGEFTGVLASAAAGLAEEDAEVLDWASLQFAEHGAALYAAECSAAAARLRQRDGQGLAA